MTVQFDDPPLERAAAPLLPPPDRVPPFEVSMETLSDQSIYGFRNADQRGRPFRLLRSQVYKRCLEDGLKLIGVTSASPGVGKSFVAANLASSLSRLADIDVYLIDLDLHRPALATRFSVPQRMGIHDYLTGDAGIDDVALRINEEKLVLVPGFRRDVATGELLTSPRGDALFAGLRALPENAIAILDMPPIFADDDAVIIGRHLDGFLLVVEDGRTTRKQALDTIRVLQPTPMIGAVLNRYRNQLFSDDYGYGLSYGYGGYY